MHLVSARVRTVQLLQVWHTVAHPRQFFQAPETQRTQTTLYRSGSQCSEQGQLILSSGGLLWVIILIWCLAKRSASLRCCRRLDDRFARHQISNDDSQQAFTQSTALVLSIDFLTDIKWFACAAFLGPGRSALGVQQYAILEAAVQCAHLPTPDAQEQSKVP